MTAERDELRGPVDDVPDEQIPSAFADVRRHLAPAAERPSPPSWFGDGESKAERHR